MEHQTNQELSLSAVDQPNSVRIDFGDNPGVEEFYNTKDLKNFVQTELIVWRPFINQLMQIGSTAIGVLTQPIQAMSQKFGEIEKAAASLTQDVSTTELPVEAQPIFLAYLERQLFHSRSPVGLFVLDDKNPLVRRIGYFLFYISQGRGVSSVNLNQALVLSTQGTFSPEVINGMMTAKLEKEKRLVNQESEKKNLEVLSSNFQALVNSSREVHSGLVQQVKDIVKSQTEAEANLTEVVKDNTAKFEKLLVDASETFNQLWVEHDEKFKGIREAFGERMRLAAPREYWHDSSDDHAQKSRNWFRLFVALVGFTIVGIVTLGFQLKTIVSYLGQALGPLQWFLIGVPTILVLWLVRSAHRQWMTHAGLANDASERVTMLETYLALTMEGKIDAVERPLILSPLFRPSSVKTDDGMPGGIIDHIVDVLNKAK